MALRRTYNRHKNPPVIRLEPRRLYDEEDDVRIGAAIALGSALIVLVVAFLVWAWR